MPIAAERRAWVRYACNQAAFCRSLAPEEYFLWTARARDISRGGISLIVSNRFEPGTILAVELLSTNQASSHAAQVRVIHVTAQPAGGWQLGCEFLERLSEDTLPKLL